MKQYVYTILFFILSLNCLSQNIINEELMFLKDNEEQNEVLFSKYVNDSLAKTITSIRFVEFDTISDKFKIFQNVHTVILEFSNTNGLDIFPCLENLYLENDGEIICEEEKWLKKIKKLSIHKSYNVRGISSFKCMSQLEELFLSYSGFEIFPSDIDSLNSLKKLVLGVYTGGTVNLNLIDLNKLLSLQEIEVISWTNNIIGIPNGIENSKLRKLKIQHPNLTKKEKQVLKSFSEKINNSHIRNEK